MSQLVGECNSQLTPLDLTCVEVAKSEASSRLVSPTTKADTKAAHAHQAAHAAHATHSTHVHAILVSRCEATGLVENLEVIDELLDLLAALRHRHHHVHGNGIRVLSEKLTVIGLCGGDWLRRCNLVKASHKVTVGADLR